jgi:hypothetical protein
MTSSSVEQSRHTESQHEQVNDSKEPPMDNDHCDINQEEDFNTANEAQSAEEYNARDEEENSH